MPREQGPTAQPSDASARAPGRTWPPILAALLGLELLVSTLLWPHEWQHHATHRFTTASSGALALVVAFVSARFPAARFLNVAVGIWLVLVSTSTLRISPWRTEWNEIFVGIVLIAVSILPSRPLLPHHRRDDRHGPLPA